MRNFRKIRASLIKRGWLVGLILGLGIGLFLAFALFANVGLLASWQRSLSDSLFVKNEPSKQIVIVGIDEKSLESVGRWPWDRSVQARLIDCIAAGDPKIIGIDVMYSEKTEPKEDKALADSLARNKNTIIPVLANLEETSSDYIAVRATSIELPADVFLTKSTDNLSHINPYRDQDGVVRSIPLMVEFKGDTYPALSLLCLTKFDPSDFKISNQAGDNRYLQLKSRKIPLEPGSRMRINYVGPPGTFTTVSAADVLSGNLDANIFKDKIVLIGATAKAIGDECATPTSEGTQMSGIEAHANAINTILKGDFIVEQGYLVTILIVLGICLVCGLIFSQLRALWSGLIAFGLAAIISIFSLALFDRGIIINLVYPPLAIFLTYAAVTTYRFVFEGTEKKRVENLFGHYVKPEIVKEIIDTADEDIIRLEGYSQTITTLFADIRGFTSMSENLEPKEVVSVLNKYLNFMTEIIFKHDGTLDKYIGDAIMAFFNAPHQQPDHALRAIKAALDMQCQVKEFQDNGQLSELPSICYGIGINTGTAVVGNIGGAKRHDYTIIGDSVNLAARFCGAAKEHQILIGPDTYELVKDYVIAEELPAIKFKGKAKPMIVYNVTGLKTD